MASSGAGVMATRSVEVARSHNVRLHVRSTFGDDDGTWIREEDETMLEKALISAVVHQREETVYRVSGTIAGAALRRARRRAASTSTRSSRTATRSCSPPRSSDRRDAERALDGLDVEWSARDDLGKVSLVGAGMKSHPGVAAKVFATLEAAGIESPIVSTSPIKIACHIRSEDVDTRRAARCTRRSTLARPRIGVVGATGAVGRVTVALLRERGHDDVRLFASARSAGTEIDGVRVEEATPEALSAGDLDVVLLLGRHVRVARARPARRRRRGGRRRQVVGLPAPGRRAARRPRGERRARARARRDRRQPELLRDPAHVRAEAAARRGRPRARPRRDLPVGVRRGRRGDGAARATSRTDEHDLADGLGLRRRGVRRGGEAPRRDAEDPRAPRAADHAPPACACR